MGTRRNVLTYGIQVLVQFKHFGLFKQMAWGLVGFGAKTASNAGDQLAQLYGYLNQCLNFILGNSSRFGTKHSQLLLLVKLIRRLRLQCYVLA